MKKILVFLYLVLSFSLTAQMNIFHQLDSLNRLLSEIYSNGTVVKYTYDELGNRSAKVVITASFTVSTIANPVASGTVSGSGSFSAGQSCTLTATANTGYAFTNWTEGSTIVSTNASYSFIVSGARNLVANFVQGINYSITLSSNPTAGGTTTGGGTYASGVSRTVIAIPNTGCTFANWTENGSVVSTTASYSFNLSANRTLVANFNNSQLPDLTTGLVAYYPFNGNANDESGNGNNGTVQGNVVLTTDRFGKVNNAYDFPGIAFNYIQVPDASSLHISIFTLNAWIYTTTDYGSGQVIQKGRDIVNGHYGLYTTSVGGTNLYSGVNGTTGIPQPSTGEWHMISGSVSGNKARFYLDGKFMKDTSLSNSFVCSGTEPLAIGMHYFAGVPSGWTYPYKGKIDDIRIYNRALSENEISNLYNLTQTATNKITVSKELTLYPNPANTFLNISSPEILHRIEVCDIAGRLIISKTVNFDKYTLETEHLVGGVYIVKGFTDNGMQIGRFVKE